MNDEPISKMQRKDIIAFLVEHFSSLRDAKKQLETFKSDVENLKINAKKTIDAETDAIERLGKSGQRVINDKTQDTRELANKKQNLIDKELQNTKLHTQKTKKLIDEQLDEINHLLENIKKYHDDLLTDRKDEEGKIVPSIKTSIDEYIKEQRGEFIKLRKNLEDEIRSLLPEAGAAGLSSAYFEAKKRYGTVPDKKNSGVFWFYFLFIAPLIVIIFLMVFGNSLGLGEFIIKGDFKYNALWNRFFISSPFAMLSWFGWGSIRLNRRLYEEYNHKQRVMQLYHSFDGEIEEYGRKDQKQKLLDIMLQNVADKPSLAVHSGKEQTEQMSFFRGLFVLTKRVTKLPDSDSNMSDTPEPTPAVNKKPKK